VFVAIRGRRAIGEIGLQQPFNLLRYPVPDMRRFILALVLTGALTNTLASTAFAADNASPLAAGKPAGVQKAQAQTDHYAWWLMAGAFLGIIAIAAAGQSTTVTTATS
jgi:hypothetical protein